nr:YbdK family carboxylate-amine ligase [Bradyrhizobium sp. 159]
MGASIRDKRQRAKAAIHQFGSAADAVAYGLQQWRHSASRGQWQARSGAPQVGILSDSMVARGEQLASVALICVNAVGLVAGAVPRILPAAPEADIDAYLDGLDGIFIGGGQTNVHPSRYGQMADEARDGPFDEFRDEIALRLIPRALARGIPALFICRGMQELNVALGGTLAKEPDDMPEDQRHGTLVGLGNPISGLHVHVEVPEPDQRVEIMHRLVPFLPLLLALSTSSPFWCGYPTGLLGYRNAANDALPRTGFPEMFRNLAEYETYVKTLVDAGIVPNATYVWWALRPSLQHPTLELRITDCCTAIADSVAMAALFRALVRHVVHHPDLNATYSPVHRALIEENRWRAQRYGTDGTYIDLASFEPISFRSWLDAVIAMLAPDIAHLGVEGDIQHLKTIPKRGTSAHLQLEYFRSLRKFGRSPREAIADVTQWLRTSTEAGDFTARGSEPKGTPVRQPLAHLV